MPGKRGWNSEMGTWSWGWRKVNGFMKYLKGRAYRIWSVIRNKDWLRRKERNKVSTLGIWIEGDILYQYRGTGGRAGLRRKMMSLGLGSGLGSGLGLGGLWSVQRSPRWRWSVGNWILCQPSRLTSPLQLATTVLPLQAAKLSVNQPISALSTTCYLEYY